MSIRPQPGLSSSYMGQPIHRSNSTIINPSPPPLASSVSNYCTVSATPTKPSYPTSIQNITMKSPSPDHCCRNMITPTKVKWALQQKSMTNIDNTALNCRYNNNNNSVNNRSRKETHKQKQKQKEKQKQKNDDKNVHNIADDHDNSNNINIKNRSGVYVQSWSTTPKRSANANNDEQNKGEINHSHLKKPQNREYINQLEQQIRILTIQNRNLLQKLSQPLTPCSSASLSIPQSSSSASSSCLYCSNPANPSSYATRSTSNSDSTRQPSSSKMIIAKIKEQYEEQLSTLRIMVEHEIKEAVSVVEDMCELMKTKILEVEGRVDSMDGVVRQAKMARILQMTETLHKQQLASGQKLNMTGRLTTNKYLPASIMLPNLDDHSFSDILCTSIPQQSDEQSRNHTMELATLQDQVQSLRANLTQLSYENNKQRQHLQDILKQKCAENYQLVSKLEESQRKRLGAERKIWAIAAMGDQDKSIITTNNGGFMSTVKEQLKMLQKSVTQIGAELTRSQKQCEQLLKVVEQKNIQCEAINTEASILRDKVLVSQKQRIFLQQKTRFLEGSVAILQSQLQQCKKSQYELQSQRTKLERQRIMRITGQARSYTSNRNLLTVTSRIDTLLSLEEQRETSIQKCMTAIHQLCMADDAYPELMHMHSSCNVTGMDSKSKLSCTGEEQETCVDNNNNNHINNNNSNKTEI